MHIILNNSSMIPIYEQLMEQIKALVFNGELKAGDSLPSVRTMASDLKISALTVKKSYDKLEEEGFVVTIHGKGSYIAENDTPLIQEARRRTAEKLMEEALLKSKELGMSKEEIHDLIDILLEAQ